MKIDLELKSIINRTVNGKKYYKWYIAIPTKLVSVHNLKQGDQISVELK